MPEYAELHSHSHHSFKEGTSSTTQLVSTSQSLGYKALALTDHDNLSGAIQFAKSAKTYDMHGIIGAELTITGNHHLTFLAKTQRGYSNLCKLISSSHVFANTRNKPELDIAMLPEYSQDLTILSGCKRGEIPHLIEMGFPSDARKVAEKYLEWLGSDNFYIELQQNLVRGDTERNRKLIKLSKDLGIQVVATNNAHYHTREYHNLHDCLIAIGCNKTLDETHRERRANSEFYLKSPDQMAYLFKDHPQAITNTIRIAESCTFDLSKDLGYEFPNYQVPEGYSPHSYLRKLCDEASIRRYGSITTTVKNRLDEEFRLIQKHDLAGFFLHYYDIVKLAHQVNIELGFSDPEMPLEESPPGRGRGSSVAMLVGYLIGLSHIDPLEYNLSLERFIPEDLISIALDIDLDFPRNIREKLILEIQSRWGWDRAALVGMRSKYKLKAATRDLGKAMDLPSHLVGQLAKHIGLSQTRDLEDAMSDLSTLRNKVNNPGWRDLIRLAKQIQNVPRYIAQHPGGIIISSRPLTDMVPIQKGAINGRYICQWDKDDIDYAGFIKIDFLSLGTLSQLQEALRLIQNRKGAIIDISRINFSDPEVYDMLCSGDTIGIFQVDSAAQMQTITRIKPRNLNDMTFEVACVRPGVGINDGIRLFINRRNGIEPVKFDHPLERRALERTLGVILYQDQLNQLAMDIGGFSPSDADQLRRAFTNADCNTPIIKKYWELFRSGASKKFVSTEIALKIFSKFNGQYMFPEAHAVAFGVTAYQLSWLKYYYTIEFITALINQQPMGFWNIETIKEDARRHGIAMLNPDINLSASNCVIEEPSSIRLGFSNVNDIGEATIKLILDERNTHGKFKSLQDFMNRVSIKFKAIQSMINVGSFDSISTNRRALQWEMELRYRTKTNQLSLDLPISQDIPSLTPINDWETMLLEYQTMGIFPSGHIMEKLRPHLPDDVITSQELEFVSINSNIKIAGLVARQLQHPSSQAYFISLEDEYGLIHLIIWPQIYEKFKSKFLEPLILVEGRVSRREGTINVIVSNIGLPDLKSDSAVEISDIIKFHDISIME